MQYFSYKLHTAFGICFQNLITCEVLSLCWYYTELFKKKNITSHRGGKKFIWQVFISEALQKQLFWFSMANYIRCFFVGLDEMRSLQKKGGYNRRIARWHFGCSWLRKETWRSAQTNYTPSSHMSCEVHGFKGGILENSLWTEMKFIICTLNWN
jgi:hypothetical protein